MASASSSLFSDIDRGYRWGQRALQGGLLGLLGLTGLILWTAPDFLLLLPVCLLGGVLVAALIRRPLVHLTVVLAGSVIILNYEEGISLQEVLYGLYYLSYLTGWFAYRLLLVRASIVHNRADAFLLLFLLYATATFGLTVVFGGNLATAFSQWLPLTILAFYFPIKEACMTNARAASVLAGTFAFIALFVVLRNAVVYYTDLQQAEALWQIVTGRERLNERFLLIGVFGTLALALYAHRWAQRGLLLMLATLFLAGIFIGQSRAVWLSVSLGAGLMFFLVDRSRKNQLILWGVIALGALFSVGAVFLKDFFLLVISGLLDRFLSIGSATSQDVSLINRFIEWQAAWDHIRVNPILGYGFGVEYSYFSLTSEVTVSKSHIHSSYLGLLYRHGLVGLTLFLIVGLSVAWYGYQLHRSTRLSDLHRAIVLTCLVSLVALALAATTESLFLGDEGTLVLAFPLGILSGLYLHHFPTA